jgi:hypothetical protein
MGRLRDRPAPPGADCDATLIPVVTGHLHPDVLEQLASMLLPGEEDNVSAVGFGVGGRGSAIAAITAPDPGTAARELILTRATRLLCGPHGLAAWLRVRLTPGPAATISQPLDIGIPTEIIPPHLRRAVILRDLHGAFPGCERLPPGCHVHHITPRSEGGPTSLANCILLCPFHHLIAIHRWAGNCASTPTARRRRLAPAGAGYSTATARLQQPDHAGARYSGTQLMRSPCHADPFVHLTRHMCAATVAPRATPYLSPV